MPQSVVHWPHPDLFKLRFKVDTANVVKIQVTNWPKEVIPEKRRFEKSRSCAILEQLALSEIQISNLSVPDFSVLPNAIHVLEVALDLPENRNDTEHSRRLYELLARLVCLQHEKDHAQAKARLLNAKGLAQALPWVKEQDRFINFHQKTVDREDGRFRFRKRLQKRVLAAHNLVGRVSSSGKDTA